MDGLEIILKTPRIQQYFKIQGKHQAKLVILA